MSTPILPAKPIHSSTISGVPVRFFRGPGEAPDMPWHAHEDLLAALALPRSLRRVLRAALLKHWASACRTVDVDGDPVLVAPHFVAQGFIGMAQDVGREVSTTPDLVAREYGCAGALALAALTAHLPSPQERAAWAMEAFHNQGGTP